MPRTHITMYLVWEPYQGQTVDDAREYGWEYGALDEANAAKVHVNYRHGETYFERQGWPVDLRVLNTDTGKMYDVEVDREIVPEFHPGKPREVR